MTLRLSLVLAFLGHAALMTAPITFAQTQPANQTTHENTPSFTRQALEWSRNQLGELDAAMVVLEKDAAKLQGETKAQADEKLKHLRQMRDIYQAKAQEAAGSTKSWTDAQIFEARKSLDDSWIAFRATRDDYFDTAKTDLATRLEVYEAEFEARRKAWQKMIGDLKEDATKTASSQRTAIEKRISDLNILVAKSPSIERIKNNSAEAYESANKSYEYTKHNYEETQKIFFDTYRSIRDSIEESAK